MSASSFRMAPPLAASNNTLWMKAAVTCSPHHVDLGGHGRLWGTQPTHTRRARCVWGYRCSKPARKPVTAPTWGFGKAVVSQKTTSECTFTFTFGRRFYPKRLTISKNAVFCCLICHVLGS